MPEALKQKEKKKSKTLHKTLTSATWKDVPQHSQPI